MIIRRIKKAIPLLLATALLWLSLGCGWDNTPQYVIATPTPEPTNVRWTPNATEQSDAASTPVPTDEPESTEGAQSSEQPEGTADADGTPAATNASDQTPDPNATVNPAVTPTPDPYLYGRWEFKRSRYKGKEVPASETGRKMTIRLFDNGSAEMNIYKIGDGDPPQDTQGVQWRINGATLTLTLYGETIMKLVYDGTYLIYEVDVYGDTDDLIFEKTGE